MKDISKNRKLITAALYKQINGWRIYSIIAPTIFCGISAWLYLHYGTRFEVIFYTGLIVLAITCISWWHWSLSTMVTMLAIMKDTDDHFEQVTTELKNMQSLLIEKDNIILFNKIDKDK